MSCVSSPARGGIIEEFIPHERINTDGPTSSSNTRGSRRSPSSVSRYYSISSASLLLLPLFALHRQ